MQEHWKVMWSKHTLAKPSVVEKSITIRYQSRLFAALQFWSCLPMPLEKQIKLQKHSSYISDPLSAKKNIPKVFEGSIAWGFFQQ